MDYTASYNSSRGSCKELHSHLYALSFQLIYVLLFGHHIRYCSKLVLISNNKISSNILYLLFSSCIKTGEWFFKGMWLCTLIIKSDNGLDSIGAGASSRHNIDEILLDYTDCNRGANSSHFWKLDLNEWNAVKLMNMWKQHNNKMLFIRLHLPEIFYILFVPISSHYFHFTIFRHHIRLFSICASSESNVGRYPKCWFIGKNIL